MRCRYLMRLMRLNRILLVLTFFTISLGQSNPRLITCTTIDTDHYTKEITVTFTVPKKDFIYKDFITFSVDDPTIILSSWKANKQSVAHYDSSFKEAKQVFNEDFSITMMGRQQLPSNQSTRISLLQLLSPVRKENKSCTFFIRFYSTKKNYP